MLLDQFWKIIFLVILCVGFSFWWQYRTSQKTYGFLIDELGELITAEVKPASPKGRQANPGTLLQVD